MCLKGGNFQRLHQLKALTRELRDCVVFSTHCPQHLRSEFAFYKRGHVGFYKLEGSSQKIAVLGQQDPIHATFVCRNGCSFCPSGLFVALWVEGVLTTPALQHLLTQGQPEVEMPVLSISPIPGCQGNPHPTKEEKDNFVTYFYQRPAGTFKVCDQFLPNAYTCRGHS